MVLSNAPSYSKFFILGCKVLITLLWLLFIGVVSITYLPHSPLTLSGKTSLVLKVIFPQGWGFFTKGPRDPDVFMYLISDDKLVSALKIPNSSGKNLYGLKRDARAQGAEYGLLLDQAKKARATWASCNDLDINECFKSHANVNAVCLVNTVKMPTLCGRYVLFMKSPIPWAWRLHKEHLNMSTVFLRLNIRCKNEIIN
jgi:antimicrobial peptide system SdpA family protein